jgi:hypothetical protein
MIDSISVTFNKSTNNFNIPFAIIAPKKKKGDSSKDLRLEMARPHNRNDAYSAFPNGNDPYSNVIGIQAVFTQDNILEMSRPHLEMSRPHKLADYAYDNIIRPELEEQEDLFIENEINQLEIEQLERKKHVDKYTKLYINSMNKKIVNEVLPKGLYDKGLMVELSYAIQHAQTNEHIEDANSDFMTQLQNQNLDFYPNLSNRNSAVINDPVSGKWYVAYHGANGAMEGVDKQNIKDVINGNYSKNAEFLESESQLKQLLSFLESNGVNVGEDVELVGYSLGGSKSLMLAFPPYLPDPLLVGGDFSFVS